jgi:hypothetical protein
MKCTKCGAEGEWRKPRKYNAEWCVKCRNVEKTRQYKLKPQNKPRLKLYNRRYEVTRRINDPSFRLIRNLRSRLWCAVKHVEPRPALPTWKYLGCDLKTFMKHLENSWKPGMNWDNYGTEWEVDHVRPCFSFDMEKDEDRHACFRYQNTQALWTIDNQNKHVRRTDLG